ncbi:CLUMA_CG014017, isoform A [Clunio marinus]|uniref:CLUMA_CG014017, isoform A n=1 Tax=Clunio marinus TaxID=568069 RepID=A0A1J1ILY6_9DIPT|nr:CLUMA_CG014017, isoform A [Clunio marinus]
MQKPTVDNNDKMLKALRELVASGSNRQCFDCGQKGVTYVNMTCGSFSCTSCSGILRGLTPPHRVKSISMAKFTTEELEFLQKHGNDECSKTWLGLWDSKRVIKQDQRDFIIDKYEKKRYYLESASPLKSISTAIQQQQNSFSNEISKTNNNNGLNDKQQKSIQIKPTAIYSRHRTQNGLNNGSDCNNNFFSQQNVINGKSLELNSSPNESIKSSQSNDFMADFSKANIYNSNNSLNSTGSGGQMKEKMSNGFATNNMSENFADFENNTIYNAGGFHKMSIGGNAKNFLKSNNKAFNSNMTTTSTPTEDRYAALKDLDEQLREAKSVTNEIETKNLANPFKKNPFQTVTQDHEQFRTQQPFHNWTNKKPIQMNGIEPSFNSNDFINGFYYNHNMVNGFNSQHSSSDDKNGFGNPFMTSGPVNTNNPFL